MQRALQQCLGLIVRLVVNVFDYPFRNNYVWPHFHSLSFHLLSILSRVIISDMMVHNPLPHNGDGPLQSQLILMRPRVSVTLLIPIPGPESHCPDPRIQALDPSHRPPRPLFPILALPFLLPALPPLSTHTPKPLPQQFPYSPQSRHRNRGTRIPHTQACLPKTVQTQLKPFPPLLIPLPFHRQRPRERDHPPTTHSRDHEPERKDRDEPHFLRARQLQAGDQGHGQDDDEEVEEEVDRSERDVQIAEGGLMGQREFGSAAQG